jgi:hypothetical protein
MPWIKRIKRLPITNASDHPCARGGVIGRTLSIRELQFTPIEFFGAAVRCSHMHLIDPGLVAPESSLIAAIAGRHVDDVSADFAILASANGFKDDIKVFFTGTVATALSYLTMVQDGYDWVGHFESVIGRSFVGDKPDFVFAGRSTGIALAEAKGTRSEGIKTFDSKVEAGYLGQVEPHIGADFGGLVATHGYCIGSWLTSTTKAELIIHQTAGGPVSTVRRQPDDQALAQVQQQNYATALTLVTELKYGSQLRRGYIEDFPQLERFEWLGRNWLSYPLFWRSFSAEVFAEEIAPSFFRFAIEERNAAAVFDHFGGGDTRSRTRRPIDVETLPRGLIEKARLCEGSAAGAVFPDGLAVISLRTRTGSPESVIWNPNTRQFLPSIE